jgi:hypothetical protein
MCTTTHFTYNHLIHLESWERSAQLAYLPTPNGSTLPQTSHHHPNAAADVAEHQPVLHAAYSTPGTGADLRELAQLRPTARLRGKQPLGVARPVEFIS